MSKMKIIVILLINFLFQTTLLNIFEIRGVVPNTGLIVVVSIAIIVGKKEGLMAGLIQGLMHDIMFNSTLGVNMLVYFILIIIIGSLYKKVFVDNPYLPVIMIVISTILSYVIELAIVSLLGIKLNIIDLIQGKLLIEIVYNIVLSIVIYNLILKNYKKPSVRFSNDI